jgi:hypothetical protein
MQEADELAKQGKAKEALGKLLRIVGPERWHTTWTTPPGVGRTHMPDGRAD